MIYKTSRYSSTLQQDYQPVSSEMFGSHATLVVVMASAIFGLCLGEKLPNMSLSNSKDVKFENCKNSNASSKVEFVKLSPCKHTPCVPRFYGTGSSLYIGFIPAEEVRRMHFKMEVGGQRVIDLLSQPWIEMRDPREQRISRDICLGHLANSSCPLKAGAPIYIIWPFEAETPDPYTSLFAGIYQWRFTLLHSNGKPFLCFKIPVQV